MGTFRRLPNGNVINMEAIAFLSFQGDGGAVAYLMGTGDDCMSIPLPPRDAQDLKAGLEGSDPTMPPVIGPSPVNGGARALEAMTQAMAEEEPLGLSTDLSQWLWKQSTYYARIDLPARDRESARVLAAVLQLWGDMASQEGLGSFRDLLAHCGGILTPQTVEA
jgi:hypothetical protein